MDLKIGNVIRKLRAEHSVTQEELAAYLGISYQAVSKWETGATMPDIALLPRLAAFFGIRIDELFSVSHEDDCCFGLTHYRYLLYFFQYHL